MRTRTEPAKKRHLVLKSLLILGIVIGLTVLAFLLSRLSTVDVQARGGDINLNAMAGLEDQTPGGQEVDELGLPVQAPPLAQGARIKVGKDVLSGVQDALASDAKAFLLVEPVSPEDPAFLTVIYQDREDRYIRSELKWDVSSKTADFSGATSVFLGWEAPPVGAQ